MEVETEQPPSRSSGLVEMAWRSRWLILAVVLIALLVAGAATLLSGPDPTNFHYQLR